MNSPLPKSRFLLVPEARPPGPAGERPKVRRYRLARLQASRPAAVRAKGFDRTKSSPS